MNRIKLTPLLAVSFLLLGWAPLAGQLPTPETSTGKLAMLVSVPILGWLATKAYAGVKQIVPAWDRLPAVVHQAGAPVLAFAFGWVGSHLGLAVADSFAGIDWAWINGGLVALAGAGIWRAEKHPV